jgi:ATP-dependent Lhr-like helicase
MENPANIIARALSAEQTESWISASQMSKRAFRDVAIISGLIERRIPGKRKTGRQVTISTDLIYDVLRKYDPDHILLQATHEDVVTRIADTARLRAQLSPLPVLHKNLPRLSPLAVPLILEVGIEKIKGGKGEIELLTGHTLDTIRNTEGDELLSEAAA